MVGETFNTNNDSMIWGKKHLSFNGIYKRFSRGKKVSTIWELVVFHSEWRYLAHIQQRSSRSRVFCLDDTVLF